MAKKVHAVGTTCKIQEIPESGDPTFAGEAVLYVKTIGTVGSSIGKIDTTCLADKFVDYEANALPEGNEVTLALFWDNSDLDGSSPTGQALLWQSATAGTKIFFKMTFPDPDGSGSETSRTAIFLGLLTTNGLGPFERDNMIGMEYNVQIVPSTISGAERLVHLS